MMTNVATYLGHALTNGATLQSHCMIKHEPRLPVHNNIIRVCVVILNVQFSYCMMGNFRGFNFHRWSIFTILWV